MDLFLIFPNQPNKPDKPVIWKCYVQRNLIHATLDQKSGIENDKNGKRLRKYGNQEI